MKTIGVGIVGASPGAGRAGHQPSRQRQHPGHRVGSGRRSRIGPQRRSHPRTRRGHWCRAGRPARNVAGLYAAFAHDLSEGTTVAPSFSDAVHLHRLIDRIAGGASIAGVTLQPDFKENSCAPQS
jgi:predicted dehydrogenase